MPTRTPLQKLQKANDDYHGAVNEILMDETVPVDVKVGFAHIVQSVFEYMKAAQDRIAGHYEGE